VPIHEKQHLWPMTVTAVAPMAAENLPATQLVQTEAPAAAEYVPASQLEQVATEVAPTAVENLPAGHKRHTASEFAPVVEEYLPATQSVQTVEAGAPEYLPATTSPSSSAHPHLFLMPEPCWGAVGRAMGDWGACLLGRRRTQC
jgi:hypothetical protein